MSADAPTLHGGVHAGSYSTAIYVGLGLASIGLGPVMATSGYAAGFTLAGVSGGLGTLSAIALWGRGRAPR